MLFLKIDPARATLREIEQAGKILAKGGIAIYPTDTVYGLGCDVTNRNAVNRIYELKKREAKPLPILISSINVALRIAQTNDAMLKLSRKFWPGGLTIKIYPAINFLSQFLDEEGKIAIRVPDHPIPRILADFIGGMIVGTSANISGREPPTTAESALKQIGDVDVVIDSGPSKIGKPSTIIDVTGNEIKLVREGAIPFSRILEELEVD
ncbi:MAG: L-threonylcarbamoyladenylate synthase [Fervidicoccaceae archaeon]